MSAYIYVRNWERFQHYKNRRPAWIKLYVSLLDDDRFLALSLADRGLLQDLWKLAALSGDGRVSADRKSLARRLNVRRVSLDPLIHAGFIEVRASRALADRSQPARAETEAETETEVVPDSSARRSKVGAPAPRSDNGEGMERIVAGGVKASSVVATDAIGQAVRAMGGDADSLTEKTIRAYVRQHRCTQYEVEQARSAIQFTPRGTSRAAYFMGALKSQVKERGG